VILDAFRLDGRVAIVTGAGRGIGAEIARAFAEVGARVLCVARTASEIEDTADSIRAAGGEAETCVADVTGAGEPERIARAALGRFGRLDVLVNDAGGRGHVPTRRARDEDFFEAMALNFRAPVYLTRAAAPALRERGGAVVNVSSGFARVAHVGSIPYGGAKAALEQATRMLALEYAPEVRVNAIRVGACRTGNMQKNLLEAVPGIEDRLVAWTPLRRLGEPEDVARAALFLASEASSYVTARVLDVDGGVTLERSALELIETATREDRG
jgi:7-alpha-hydroxysteroid dehydrogenase